MNPMNPMKNTPTRPTLETCVELIHSAQIALRDATREGDEDAHEENMRAWREAYSAARKHGYTIDQISDGMKEKRKQVDRRAAK